MFMPLEEKTLVFATFLQRQGRKSSKNTAIYTVLKRMRRKRCVLRCFFNKGLQMYRKYHGFLHFLLPGLKANQPKTLVFTVF